MPLPSGLANVVGAPRQGLRIRNEDPNFIKKSAQSVKQPIKQPIKQNRPPSQPDKVLEGFGVTMLKSDHNIAASSPSPNLEDVQIFVAKTENASADSEQHAKMVKILNGRLLRIKAARAMFTHGPDETVNYVVKAEDDSLAVDVVPMLMHRLRNRLPNQEHVSMPACFELLPILRRLLESPFEDYKVVSLDAVIAISTHWSRNLRAIAKIMNDPESKKQMEQSVSEQGLYIALVGLCSAMAALIRETPSGSPVASKAQRAAKLLIEFS